MAELTHSPRSQASAYVDAVIMHCRQQGTRRLPTIRELARGADVSHWTISGIVGDLKRQGVVEASRSRGIRLAVAPRAPDPGAPDAPRRAHQQVQRRLFQDLINGSFGFDRPLPLRKELAARYGVSVNTLRKALDCLTQENVLARHKRTYRMIPSHAHAGRNSIVLFARGNELGRIVDHNRRTGGYFQSVEQECRARNIVLRAASCYFVKRGSKEMTFTGRDGRSFAPGFVSQNILGFMVWQSEIVRTSEAFRDELLRFLRPFRKPLALFWDNTEPRPLPGIGASRRIRSFAFMRDFEVGRQVGQYLLALGHCRVCCLSAEGDASWTVERTGGIRAAFAAAGCGDAVSAIAIQTTEAPWMPAARKTIHNAITAVTGEQRIPLQRDSAWALESDFMQNVGRALVRRRAGEYFRRLAKDPSITAWVGLNDEIAVEALIYLRSNKVRVPEDVSVMGFDDSMEAGFQGLTSYCFNGASAMHLMTEYIVRAASPLIRGDAGKPVIIEGFVHERATTGRARVGVLA